MKRALFVLLMMSILLPSAAFAGPSLQVEALRFDFGKVKQGEVLTHVFKFTNVGDEDLIIEQLKPN